MSDLISRSALMSHIECEKRIWGDDLDVDQILGDIEDFESAYDVEKVVDSLRNSCYQIGLDESMTEILVEDVRKGGVNERD